MITYSGNLFSSKIQIETQKLITAICLIQKSVNTRMSNCRLKLSYCLSNSYCLLVKSFQVNPIEDHRLTQVAHSMN